MASISECVNFVRLLHRVHQRALRSGESVGAETLSIDDTSNINALRQRLATLQDAAATKPLPRPLDLIECQRKLSYICEVLQIIPSGQQSCHDSITVQSNESNTHCQTEINAEVSGIKSAKARQAQKWREALFSIERSAPFCRRRSRGCMSERSNDSRYHEDTIDFDSSHEESPSQSALSAATSSARHSNLFDRDVAAFDELADQNENEASIVHREEIKHEKLMHSANASAEMLKNRLQDINAELKTQNKELDGIEDSNITRLDGVGRISRRIVQHGRDATRFACGTYFLLMLVAVSFMLTYGVIRLFPKPKYTNI